MNDFEVLKRMWRNQPRRSVDLIVGKVIYQGITGRFDDNAHWFFVVNYCFRNALDIRYTPHKVDGLQVMLWTQGPIIGFDVGDHLHAKDGTCSVLVTYAQPMGWDDENNKMNEGVVTYSLFDNTRGTAVMSGNKTLSQMDFLKLLIKG